MSNNRRLVRVKAEIDEFSSYTNVMDAFKDVANQCGVSIEEVQLTQDYHNYPYDDKDYYYMYAYAHRYENDEEYNARIIQDAKTQSETEKREREVFERLKAKYKD